MSELSAGGNSSAALERSRSAISKRLEGGTPAIGDVPLAALLLAIERAE